MSQHQRINETLLATANPTITKKVMASGDLAAVPLHDLIQKPQHRSAYFDAEPFDSHQHSWLTGDHILVCCRCGISKDKPK